MITNSLLVCICPRNTQQGSVMRSSFRSWSFQMYSTYYMYKHRILLLNLGMGILRDLRVSKSQIWIHSYTHSAWALTAVGQGNLLNKPERWTAGDLKFPDSLWGRGLDAHMTTAMQIISFLPYMQKVSAHISRFQTGTHICGADSITMFKKPWVQVFRQTSADQLAQGAQVCETIFPSI